MKSVVKFFTAVSVFLILSFTAAKNVSAVDAPDFPSCLNPQVVLRVSYDSGTHGIVGSGAVYTGTDRVYTVNENQLMQCFCSADGRGIQTNWWKISSLDGEQIQTLKNMGWYYIPTGSSWGLLDVPYMAKNETYVCGGGTGGTGETSTGSSNPGPAGPPVCNAAQPEAPQLISVVKTGSHAVVTWTKVENASYYALFYGTSVGDYTYGVPNTGNQTSYTVYSLDPNKTYYFSVRAVNDCMPSNPSGGQFAILGAATGIGGGVVLGLALTGGSSLLFALAGSGIILLLVGYLLHSKRETS